MDLAFRGLLHVCRLRSFNKKYDFPSVCVIDTSASTPLAEPVLTPQMKTTTSAPVDTHPNLPPPGVVMGRIRERLGR